MAVTFKVRGLSFTYRQKDGSPGYRIELPELDLNSGDVYAITGVSGCGKSTLLECLGLLRQNFEAQTLSLDSYELTKLSAKEQSLVRSSLMGYMPQTGGLIPYLTLKENLVLQIEVSADSFYKLTGKKTDTKKNYLEVLEKMQRFSMETFLDRYPHELSIGQRQRAVFLKTVSHSPKIVFIDEPTSSLDPEHGKILFESIVSLSRQLDMCALVVTHDLDLVQVFSLKSLSYESVNERTGCFTVSQSDCKDKCGDKHDI